jgi:hypothetical protein
MNDARAAPRAADLIEREGEADEVHRPASKGVAYIGARLPLHRRPQHISVDVFPPHGPGGFSMPARSRAARLSLCIVLSPFDEKPAGAPEQFRVIVGVADAPTRPARRGSGFSRRLRDCVNHPDSRRPVHWAASMERVSRGGADGLVEPGANSGGTMASAETRQRAAEPASTRLTSLGVPWPGP